MNFYRTVRGNFVCFRPIGGFNAGTVVHFRKAIADDLLDNRRDFAIDLRKLQDIEVSGARFFRNLQETLHKMKRKITFFGGESHVIEALKSSCASSAKFYETLEDFEYNFHEIAHEVMANYWNLSYGTEHVRTLNLRCPICQNDKVKGFTYNPNDLEMYWVDYSITPLWRSKGESKEVINLELYKVPVCNECYFATSRLDWFDVILEEGEVLSSLDEGQRERIGNRLADRKDLEMNYPSISQATFFGFPREKKAAYVSWHLNEMTARDMAYNKSTTDGFEIAYSQFAMCAYTEDEEKIESHLSKALAWLHGVQANKSNFSTARNIQNYVYLVSVYLARGKLSEAIKIQLEMDENYSLDKTSFAFWFGRVKDLINDEKEGMSL
ncbi:STAS domain-containing protein [bacterium]|nr:STAS domain-containing protein [bacterium]